MADKVIKFNNIVTVIGQKGSKYLEEGKEYKVHKELADKLIKKGAAKLKGKAE